MMAYGESTTLAERKRRAAKRMILGFLGTDIPQETRSFVHRAAPAGYILFARNIESPQQVLSLNTQLRELHKNTHLPIISVDQEGGRVRRIRETNWPSMRYVGNIDDHTITKDIAKGITNELLALGFNTNWAPVTDVDSNPDNPVIGDRSFGRSPELCAEHVQTFLETMHECGMIGCLKHFPGHGDTDLDSHLALPTVEKEQPDLEDCELYPFAQNINTTRIVMTAHVMFPAFDEQYPATMSQTIIQGILRDRFAYNGIVVSDDMEMKAVRGRWPLAQQLDLSCKAGVDLFLFCKEAELQEEAFETLVHLQENDPAHDRLAIASEKRLDALQQYLTHAPHVSSTAVGKEEYIALSEFVLRTGQLLER